ncbi:hypothetical protein HKX48_004601 [Thoreauomyces humboldtii]|nr:hypothetical protein HKX48_004601 [Thoreauomyces humboldtii]
MSSAQQPSPAPGSDSATDASVAPPIAMFKRGKGRSQQKLQARKRPLVDPDASSDDDADDHSGSVADASSIAKKLREKNTSSFTSSTGGVAAKRRKEAAAVHNSTAPSKLDVAYATSGTAANLAVDSATRTLDVDGTEDPDAPPPPPPLKVLAGDAAESADNLYRGMSGYKEYVNKRTDSVTQSNASRIRAGPLRGSTNVRLSTRIDYQPDVCKDYKETGYCGYGDSCKFMHDRGDYKNGWQIDKEWDEAQKAKALDPNRFLIDGEEGDAAGEEDAGSDDELPFACVICRNEFKDPIVTRCEHYFCESCALKQHSKSIKCFICGTATQGLFKPAKDLQAKIKEKKRRTEEREAAARADNDADLELDGGGGDDDDE